MERKIRGMACLSGNDGLNHLPNTKGGALCETIAELEPNNTVSWEETYGDYKCLKCWVAFNPHILHTPLGKLQGNPSGKALSRLLKYSLADESPIQKDVKQALFK